MFSWHDWRTDVFCVDMLKCVLTQMAQGQHRTPSSVCRLYTKYLLCLSVSVCLVCSSEWKPAVDLAAIDCAAEVNRKLCAGFGITGYPTIKVFCRIWSVYTHWASFIMAAVWACTYLFSNAGGEMWLGDNKHVSLVADYRDFNSKDVLEQVWSQSCLTVNLFISFSNNSPCSLKDVTL